MATTAPLLMGGDGAGTGARRRGVGGAISRLSCTVSFEGVIRGYGGLRGFVVEVVMAAIFFYPV